MSNVESEELEIAHGVLNKSREYLGSMSKEELIHKFYPLIRETAVALKQAKVTELGEWFLGEFDDINTSIDSERLTYLSIIHLSSAKGEQQSSGADLQAAIASEGALRNTKLFYELTVGLAGGAGEIKQTELDSKLAQDFEWLVSVTIGRLYKKSPLWKQKLMWQLVKEWNSSKFNSGTARLVRERLGEDEALALFRQTANEIMNSSELIDKATMDYQESNPYANQ